MNRAVWEARRAQGQTTGIRISNDALRQSLAQQHLATLEDSIAESEKVVQRQPDNGFAMLQAAIGHALRASLAESEAESARDVQIANGWDGRFRTQWGKNFSPEAERNIAGGLLSRNITLGSDPRAAVGAIIAGATAQAPPPPPPRGVVADGGQIPVASVVAEGNLVKKVQPIYPPLARAGRVQGAVEFRTVIDKTGHVQDVQLVRGHPLLVSAAREAVLQWEYRPILLNGNPVEVITNVTVNFILGGISSSGTTHQNGAGDKPPDTGPH